MLHNLQMQEDVSCLSKLFQFYASQLNVIEDSIIAILVLDILACLTHGLKKSHVVSLLCFNALKTLYPTQKSQLLLGRTPISLIYIANPSKRGVKNITSRFLLTMIFKLCSMEIRSEALCQLTTAMKDFSTDNINESRSEHDLLIQLNSESFPIVS